MAVANPPRFQLRDDAVRKVVAVAADANGGIAPLPNYTPSINLDQMLKQEQDRAEKYIDGVFQYDDLNMVPLDGNTIGFVNRRGAGTFAQPRPLTTRAEYHLAIKMNVPSGFFSKSSAKLKLQILEEHGKFGGKEMFLRVDENGACRAVLSPRYAILDDAEVLSATIKLLQGNGGVAAYVNKGDTYMHARVLFPELGSMTDNKGSRLHLGIQIRNSEVGMSSLAWEPVVFRVDCWNGLIFPEKYGNIGDNGDEEVQSLRVRHSGDKSRDIFANLEAALAKIVKSAPQHFERIERAAQRPAGEDFLERITDKYALPKGFDAQVAALIPSPATATVWDYVNAVTASAQGRSLEQRIAIERAAGSMLATIRN